MVARDKNMQNKLKARGLSLTNLDTIFLHLEQLLISNISHACIFDVNWDLWFKQSQEKSQYDIASKFISMRGQKDEQITLKKMLTGCHSKQQETIVCNFLTSIIADSMNVDQVTISLTQQLSMIGVDSLSTVELQLNIERSLGFDNLKVPLNNKMSIKQLAKWLTKEEVIKNFKP
jgi:acyl carrier protein